MAGEDGEQQHDPPPPGPGGPRRSVLIAGGLVVGLLIGAVAAWVTRGDDEERSAPTTSSTVAESAEAAAAFVDGWGRSRSATFVSASLLTRTTASGAEIEIPIVVAQRPPDRVISTGSSVQGTVGGEDLVCDAALDGLLQCRTTPAAEDPAEALEDELADLRGYFSGDLPIYRVAQDGECFDLRLTRAVQAPPYGQRARFCFDAESGAPSLLRVERLEGTDEVSLLGVRTEVTDDDFARVAAGDVDEDFITTG